MPRKDPKLERRKELILAAVSTIAEHGFDRLTMARVAKTAKASPAELREYFRDKRELLAETLRALALKYETRWRDKVHRAAAPIEKLKAMVEADFDPMVSHRSDGIVWYGFWREAQWRPDCQQICLNLSNAYFEQARAIIQQIADQAAVGRIGPGVVRASDAPAAVTVRAVHEARRAMAADIVEGAQHAVIAADDKGALAQHIQRGVVARSCDLTHMADDLPVLQQEIAAFEREELGIVVGPSRQRFPAERGHRVCAL